jgi:hypothetical protein
VNERCALRKTAAIFLMLVLLFNIGGYRVAIYFVQEQADLQLESRLDQSDYEEAQLIEIEVALNMPYQERFTEFERHYGEIEIDGKAYTYVKRKIQGDKVIFKCIPNESKEQLQTIEDGLAQSNSGMDGSKRTPTFLKITMTEFEQQLIANLNSPAFEVDNKTSTDLLIHIPESPADLPYHPPKSTRTA